MLLGSVPYKRTIFWKSIMRSFTWIEINFFNRFRFLPEVSTNLQKCTILGNLKTITQEGEKKIRQILPFLIYFLSSVCVTFNFVFENCQNSFSWGPTLVHSFWSTQYLNLEVKAVTLELCLVRFNKHTHRRKWKTKFYFFYQIENKSKNIQGNLMI